ncbi:uncharacterized protein [Miscanthus floridulus]|uniref:uncharacterized protein n=1 Tax=Miscanthus floridulus TaxID=154761 RepID=UPI003458D0FC
MARWAWWGARRSAVGHGEEHYGAWWVGVVGVVGGDGAESKGEGRRGGRIRGNPGGREGGGGAGSGLAFRGNDESEESSNRGNFIELLKFLAGNSDEVNKYVLNNAPVLIAVAKGNTDCKTFFDQVSILLNIIGVSCKRHGMLRNARLENIKKSLQCGELESGSGLNQEMGLPRPGDTRWGSHYKTICSIITMYSSIHDVLIELGADIAYKDDWTKIHFVLGAFETFEFVFFVHLMYVILGYTNELSECLQKRDQDILNAISLVNVAKSRMQQMRSDGWDKFHKTVTSFCITHGVEVPAMDDAYVPYGKSARHKVYDMVYFLLKLVLLLPVATTSVERVFSALVIVKTKSRNKLGDIVLDDCLQTFIERDIFFQVDEDDIIETFMSLRKRWIDK